MACEEFLHRDACQRSDRNHQVWIHLDMYGCGKYVFKSCDSHDGVLLRGPGDHIGLGNSSEGNQVDRNSLACIRRLKEYPMEHVSYIEVACS